MLPYYTSSAARTALIYITAGALLVIWTGVWYFYLRQSAPEGDSRYYWCGGFAVTGIALIVIGLGVGQIGRAARNADYPPTIIAPPTEVAKTESASALISPAAPPAPLPAAAPPVVPVTPVPIAVNDRGVPGGPGPTNQRVIQNERT
jgi:hypothetical protein